MLYFEQEASFLRRKVFESDALLLFDNLNNGTPPTRGASYARQIGSVFSNRKSGSA